MDLSLPPRSPLTRGSLTKKPKWSKYLSSGKSAAKQDLYLPSISPSKREQKWEKAQMITKGQRLTFLLISSQSLGESYPSTRGSLAKNRSEIQHNDSKGKTYISFILLTTPRRNLWEDEKWDHKTKTGTLDEVRRDLRSGGAQIICHVLHFFFLLFFWVSQKVAGLSKRLAVAKMHSSTGLTETCHNGIYPRNTGNNTRYTR